MFESLITLDQELREQSAGLNLFYGDPLQVIKAILETSNVNEIFFNRDYTPFAGSRDRLIYELGKQHGVDVHQKSDLLLNEPEAVHKDDHTPYTVFTPFFKRAAMNVVRAPVLMNSGHFVSFGVDVAPTFRRKLDLLQELLPARDPNLITKGGTLEALRLLAKVSELANYQTVRDIPALPGTSLLSTHNRFGTISIREFYSATSTALGRDHGLVRQLYWRDFFYHIAHHFPHVFGHAFHRYYDNLLWREAPEDFERWCAGETGFPIVDAGMRQLNTTGYMHNRLRMIVASFLVKDLHINWQLGERYFATKLLDYDPCVNNGSWQWASSTGCDAQPYFRIFNPWLQQSRFDPQCEYIKRWVPELRDLHPKQIHALANERSPAGYPAPIVEHAVAKVYAEEMFAEAKKLAIQE